MRPLTIPRRCEREQIFTYGQVADEYIKQSLQLPIFLLSMNQADCIEEHT